ncbi:MAG: serine protease AprX [Actinomycetota bacterium]|jgi:serine protease AprX|nr:serine protease AprX [Actinomycetota bacterium]
MSLRRSHFLPIAVLVSLIAAGSMALSPVNARVLRNRPVRPAFVEGPVVKGVGVRSALVHIRPEATIADGLAAARSAGAAIGTRYDVIKVFVAYATPAQFERLAKSPAIEALEANRKMKLFTNTSHKATRGQDVLDGAVTMPDGTIIDGRGIGVAEVDSGIDGTHPDLVSRMGGNVKIICSVPQFAASGANPELAFKECRGPKQAVELDDTDTPSLGGHGTHVAGIIAGTGAASNGLYHGAAPGATLYGVSVGTTISVENGLDGLAWVLENHDLVTPQIRVVSNSWGSGHSDYDPQNSPFHKATWLLQDALVADGVVVVFANGNDSGNGSASTTSGQCVNPTPGIICVANYDDRNSGTRSGAISTSSSRGAANDPTQWPDISAPGTSIISTCRATLPVCATGLMTSPPNSYATLSGTSMAAPHISGIVAQLLQVDPTLTPAEVENIIEDTAYKFQFGSAYGLLTDPYNTDNTSSFEKGHGLVDVVAAVQYVLNPPDPNATPSPTPTPTPTATQPPPPSQTTRYYFHSVGPTRIGPMDWAYSSGAFDATAPTGTSDATWTDVPVLGSTAADNPVEPNFSGTVTGAINSINLDFWAIAAEEGAQASEVSIVVNYWHNGVMTATAPFLAPVADPTQPFHVQHTLSGLNLPATDQPFSIAIRGNFINSAGFTVFYDSTNYPSGFSVTG